MGHNSVKKNHVPPKELSKQGEQNATKYKLHYVNGKTNNAVLFYLLRTGTRALTAGRKPM